MTPEQFAPLLFGLLMVLVLIFMGVMAVVNHYEHRAYLKSQEPPPGYKWVKVRNPHGFWYETLEKI